MERVRHLYGLIGYPLTHSFSQQYFNTKFEAENISARYVNFEISDISQLKDIIDTHPELNGLNVTIPYKEQIIPFLDDIDADATEIGAVNVVKFIRFGNRLKLKGYNSDCMGFQGTLQQFMTPDRNKALILGTGGASKAVRQALGNCGITSTFVSRTPSNGQLGYSDLSPRIMNEHKIIVNTTPLGMYPHVDEAPDIPYHLLTPKHLCYDLLYNPDITLFMKKAAERGAEVKNGLEMLLLQAFASWEIWLR